MPAATRRCVALHAFGRPAWLTSGGQGDEAGGRDVIRPVRGQHPSLEVEVGVAGNDQALGATVHAALRLQQDDVDDPATAAGIDVRLDVLGVGTSRELLVHLADPVLDLGPRGADDGADRTDVARLNEGSHGSPIHRDSNFCPIAKTISYYKQNCNTLIINGGDTGTRTPDLLHAMQAL